MTSRYAMLIRLCMHENSACMKRKELREAFVEAVRTYACALRRESLAQASSAIAKAQDEILKHEESCPTCRNCSVAGLFPVMFKSRTSSSRPGLSSLLRSGRDGGR